MFLPLRACLHDRFVSSITKCQKIYFLPKNRIWTYWDLNSNYGHGNELRFYFLCHLGLNNCDRLWTAVKSWPSLSINITAIYRRFGYQVFGRNSRYMTVFGDQRAGGSKSDILPEILQNFPKEYMNSFNANILKNYQLYKLIPWQSQQWPNRLTDTHTICTFLLIF